MTPARSTPAAHAVVAHVTARFENQSVVFACTVGNGAVAPVYLLYLSMYGGEPDIHARYFEDGTAEINIGSKPVDRRRLIQGVKGCWLSRSAGEPIEPGQMLRFEAALPLPLREPGLVLPDQGGRPPVVSTVSQLRVILRYADAPPKPPPKAPRRGFDLGPHASVTELVRSLGLSTPIPFCRRP